MKEHWLSRRLELCSRGAFLFPCPGSARSAIVRRMRRKPPKNVSKPTPTRRRGRPVGSAPYRDADEELLAGYADQVIQYPDLELAPFARRAATSNPAAIRRLHARWRAGRER